MEVRNTMSLELAAIIISTLSLVVAIIAVFYFRSQAITARVQTQTAIESFRILRNEYVDDHDYRRRQYAAELIRQWDTDIFVSRSIILAIWADRFNHPESIPWNEIMKEREKELVNLNVPSLRKDDNITAGSNIYFVTDHMTRILNFFELVTHCVYHRIADEEILKTFFMNPFYNWYRLLADFKQELTARRKYDPWDPVDKLYERWRKDAETLREREKTGQSL